MSDEKPSKKTSIWAYVLIGAAGLGLLMFDMPFTPQGGSQTVATVEGRDISVSQLNNAVSTLQSQFPTFDAKTLQEQALTQLIRQALLESHALSSNFVYSQQALHADIKSQFGSDEAYQSWLRERGLTAASYQDSLSQSGTVTSYYQTLAASAPANSVLFDALLQDFAQSHDYTVIRLPLDVAAAHIPADSAAIEAWYQAHPEAFMSPERVNIRFLILDSAVLADASSISEDDIAAKRRQNEQRAGQYLIFDDRAAADAAAQALASGEKTFADLTAEVQNGTIAGESGDLSLQRHGQGVDPVVDDALFALENTGDVTPVLTSDNFNAMIATLTERRESDGGDIRGELLRAAGEARYAELAEKAFDAALNNKPLSQIAELTGARIDTLDDLIPGTGEDWLANAKVQASLFGDAAVAVDKVAEPVELAPGRSVFYEITARTVPELRPYADVSAEAETLWRRDEAGKVLDTQSAAIAKAWQNGDDIDALVSASSGERQSYTGLNRLLPPEGVSAELASRLMQQSEVISLETADNGDRLMTHLDAVHRGNSAELPAELRELLAGQWRLTRVQTTEDAMAQWLGENGSVKIQEQNLPQP